MLSSNSSRSHARRSKSNAGLLVAIFIFVTGAPSPALAQWEIQTAPTTADLRGIHSLGTASPGPPEPKAPFSVPPTRAAHWQRCATPPDADHLDFRGIQAFDASTAIVMSSGKGPLSRLYKTTDACQSWKLLFTNPDLEGFWDAVAGETGDMVFVLGDSVRQELRVWEWKAGWEERELEVSYEAKGKAEPAEASFAASNSVSAFKWSRPRRSTRLGNTI
jgi:hypothetical protein